MFRASIVLSRRLMRAALAGLLSVLVLSLNGCDESANHLLCIGKTEEIFIGNRFAPGVLKQFGGEADDVETQTLITRVGKIIAEKSDRPDMPWEFHYVSSEVPNAFALPGHIFVTRGIVALLKGKDGQVDVDMLGGVLGHEVSHVVARHAARFVAEQRFGDLLEAAIDLITKRDVTADQNAQFVRKFLLLGYAREHEVEADRLGAVYAARAGYAKDGMLRVAKASIGVENRYPNPTPWYLRTHPYAEERVAALERQLPMLDDQAVSQVAFQAKEQCKGWWGLANLGVQYVRAKFILKSGGQIELADSSGLGWPDTVIRSGGGQRTWYRAGGQGKEGLWRIATTVGTNGKPTYTSVVGYSTKTAQEIKRKADTLLAQGQTKKAIEEYKRAIALGSSEAGTQTQLAKAYEKVGNKAGAQAAHRAVLRQEWRGPNASEAATALGVHMSSLKAIKSQLSPSRVEKKITLGALEDEVCKKLQITPTEYGSCKQTWSNAQAILQEMRRQVAAGREVITNTGQVVGSDDLVLVEDYSMEGEATYMADGRSRQWGNNGTTLTVIDATRLLYKMGASSEGLILTKTGPGTFSAHFASPEKVPYNGHCDASTVDISVQLADGEIQQRLVVKCIPGHSDYDTTSKGTGKFLHGWLSLCPDSCRKMKGIVDYPPVFRPF